MLIEVVHIKRLSKMIGHVRSARDAGVKAIRNIRKHNGKDG